MPFNPSLINQELARSVLEACLTRGTFPSFIFAGPGGIGKRTMALRFAQAVNCTGKESRTREVEEPGLGLLDPEPVAPDASPRAVPCGECSECRHIANLSHPDVKIVTPLKPESESEDEAKRGKDRQRIIDEIMKRAPEYALGLPRPESESRWNISIAAIHWLRGEMAYRPVRARRKVVIVLDADQMNQVSANAFLKTLEEPQPDSTFILVTERPHKLLDTIRSRCQMVAFSFLKPAEISGYLVQQGKAKEADAEIAAEVADGSLRRALDYLEQPEDFLLPQAIDFFCLEQPTIEACRLFAEEAEKIPIQSVVDSLLFLYRQALLVNLDRTAAYARRNKPVAHRAQTLTTPLIQRRLETLLRARRECESNVNRRLFLFTLLTMLAERAPAR
jgi:DNA polymerase III delta' subunit